MLRGMRCCRQRAPYLRSESFSCRLERALAAELLNVWLQGMELLVTVLLARNRQPPAVAAGVPHAELAAELLTLPSGLLAKVCEAIVQLKVRLEAVWVCVGGVYALFP